MPGLWLLLTGLSGSPALVSAEPTGAARFAFAQSATSDPDGGEEAGARPGAVARRVEPATPIDACADPDERHFGTVIHGNAGNDRVYGARHASRLFGDEDRDFVAGGESDDELHGGEGADTLSGGIGADRFVYASPSSSPADEDGLWSSLRGDTIVDFFAADHDRIDLSHLRMTGPDAPVTYRWSGSRPQPYSVWARPRAGDTVVYVDFDGDRRGDAAIRLLGTVALSPSSFCGVSKAGG